VDRRTAPAERANRQLSASFRFGDSALGEAFTGREQELAALMADILNGKHSWPSGSAAAA
jgi:hypothetical protein